MASDPVDGRSGGREFAARIEGAVTAAMPRLVALSEAIHAEPELAFAEYRAADLVAAELAASGFRVRRPVAGLATAFVADREGPVPSGDALTVAFCAEYDALPGIGHACGHNVIAASAVGAGIGLAAVADELDIDVRVFGTPAEESGGGKIAMLDAGLFADVDAALMVHPGPADQVTPRSSALADVAVTYTGVEAHAAAAPYMGRNAADAATIAQVALGLLRQHLLPGQQLHGIVSDGGRAPNIVPARAELLYYLRAGSAADLADLERRAAACFAAGALAAGVTHELRTVSPTYVELRQDETLAAAYREAIVALGRTPWEHDGQLGSTDMGNVSHVLPSLHPAIGIDAGGAVTHQRAFADAAVGPSADAAIRDGAIALARAAATAACDPGFRARAQARRKESECAGSPT